jgi:hypothetical protein
MTRISGGSTYHVAVPNPVFGIQCYLRSYFRELGNNFWHKNTSILCQFSVADPDPGPEKSRDRIRDGKFQIRDNHPRSVRSVPS